MNSKYKVGDVVRVKSHYDKGMGESDYPFGFLYDMMSNLGGKTCKISKVTITGNEDAVKFGDPYTYGLEEDTDHYCWHSSMFENTKGIKSHRRHHAHLNTHI